MNTYLNVCVVTKLTARLNNLGFIIYANLKQAVMVLLVLILTSSETLRVKGLENVKAFPYQRNLQLN